MTPRFSTLGAVEDLPPVGKADRQCLLGPVLREVSRAFYLTLRVLPSGMREPVGLAYLLARAADTLADTPLLPPDKRLPALLDFRRLVEGATAQGVSAIVDEVPQGDEMQAERVMLASLPQAFSMLEALESHDRELVRAVVVSLTQGMEMDLTDLAPRVSGEIRAVQNAAQLDTYVYGVAGCVGEFWTAISISRQPALGHMGHMGHWGASHMSQLGVRFGKALQMTNVLRDIPRDLRNGRCYLPQDQLEAVGLEPADLLNSAVASKARPVLAENLRLALDHYQCAEEYLLALPRRCFRLRLAVAWPLLMGLATLVKLADNTQWLVPDRPSRVSRGWVYRMMAVSALGGWSNTALRWWIRRLRRRVERSL